MKLHYIFINSSLVQGFPNCVPLKGLRVCREIFVFRQKAIQSWFTDDLCVHVVLVLLKILTTGCLSKNLKEKRPFA